MFFTSSTTYLIRRVERMAILPGYEQIRLKSSRAEFNRPDPTLLTMIDLILICGGPIFALR
jgi:hypothetical protein